MYIIHFINNKIYYFKHHQYENIINILDWYIRAIKQLWPTPMGDHFYSVFVSTLFCLHFWSWNTIKGYITDRDKPKLEQWLVICYWTILCLDDNTFFFNYVHTFLLFQQKCSIWLNHVIWASSLIVLWHANGKDKILFLKY